MRRIGVPSSKSQALGKKNLIAGYHCWQPREEEFQKEMFQSVPPANKNAPKTKSKGPNADLEIQIQEGSLTSFCFNPPAEQDTTKLDSSKMHVYYFVIAGSFLVPSHADKQIAKLQKLGYGNSIRMIDC